MVKSKRLTKGRSVTIPKEIAAETGIKGGETVDLVSMDEMVIIRKHFPKCIFCGNEAPEEKYHLCGKAVCAQCVKEIREECNNH